MEEGRGSRKLSGEATLIILLFLVGSLPHIGRFGTLLAENLTRGLLCNLDRVNAV